MRCGAQAARGAEAQQKRHGGGGSGLVSTLSGGTASARAGALRLPREDLLRHARYGRTRAQMREAHTPQLAPLPPSPPPQTGSPRAIWHIYLSQNKERFLLAAMSVCVLPSIVRDNAGFSALLSLLSVLLSLRYLGMVGGSFPQLCFARCARGPGALSQIHTEAATSKRS